MSYNVPTYETARMSFGPGIIYLGAPGATPTVEVGAVKGDSELSIDLTKLEIFAGSPQSLIKTYTLKEDIRIKFTGIEWDLDNLAYVLGAGITSVSGAKEILEFGGDMDTTNRAVYSVHRQPDGGTIEIQLFKAEGSGKISISMKEADMHEFPYEFVAMEGTVDFSNVALAENKKKFKIIRTKV